MKLYKNTAILLVIALILGAAFFVLNKKNLKEEPLKKDTQLLKVDLNNISEIYVEHKNEIFKIGHVKSKWVLLKPSDIGYDQGVIDGLPLCMEYLSYDKLISENPTELLEYGLDKPFLVSVKTFDGRTVAIEIGNPTSTGENHYARLKGEYNIYTIDSEKVDSLLLTKNKIKDKNVLSFRREMKLKTLAEDISRLSFYRNGKLVFTASKEEDGIWMIISPQNSKADNKEINNVLDALVKVMAKDFMDNKPSDLENYGLANPAYYFEFTNSIGEKRLFIGNEKIPGIESYAKTDTSNEVFSFDETGFNFLDKPLEDFLGK